jgi:hypothetical protein
MRPSDKRTAPGEGAVLQTSTAIKVSAHSTTGGADAARRRIQKIRGHVEAHSGNASEAEAFR